MMSSKNISGKDPTNSLTSDDILGKEVIDSEGNFLGVVEKIFLDKKNLNFNAIAVDKGLAKKGFIIGKGHIERVTEQAIFLKEPIVLELKGLIVFDKNGLKIGKVKKVILDENKNIIKELIVSSPLKKDFLISQRIISLVGENIILEKSKEELLSNSKQP